MKAIKMGIITESTKNELEVLESKKVELQAKINDIKSRYDTPLTQDECYDFLYSLTRLDLNLDKNRQLLIDRFVKRVELVDDKISILFYSIQLASLELMTRNPLILLIMITSIRVRLVKRLVHQIESIGLIQ